MKGFEAEGAIDGVTRFGEVEFFEEVFEDVDGGEPWHFAANKFGREVAWVDAPVAVGEVFEEEFVEGRAVEFDEGGFSIGALWARGEAGFEFGQKEAREATSESEGGDASEDVAPTKGVVVELAAPFDVGFEGDFDALCAHRFFAGGEDVFIEGVEHVDAEVEPVAVELMARGESAELRLFFVEGDLRSSFECFVSGVEATNTAAKDGDGRRFQEVD